MVATIVQQLEQYGPDRCDVMSVQQARAWCMRLAGGRYENFSVLSALVPRDLREDFAAVYAFCRWADDLGDEIGDPARSLDLLAWWRRELQQCFAGDSARPRHPVFLALQPTIQRHGLPMKPFDDLIRAFEQDQTVNRYQTWDQLLGYCRLSADPVGRLVLMLCGEERSDRLFELSDAICTALQLTNHWQDVRRDMLERHRIYIPQQFIQQAVGNVADFETRLIGSAKQGYGVDQQFLEQSRQIIRTCVERTWPLYEQGVALANLVQPHTQPLVWLFAAGGQHVLRSIEMWNFETALYRPTLSKVRKLMLVMRAWCASRRAGRHRKAVRT